MTNNRTNQEPISRFDIAPVLELSTQHQHNSEDICSWSDGTWCFYENLKDHLEFMSDDYQIIPLEEYNEGDFE